MAEDQSTGIGLPPEILNIINNAVSGGAVGPATNDASGAASAPSAIPKPAPEESTAQQPSTNAGMSSAMPQALADIINSTVPPPQTAAANQKNVQQQAIQQAMGNRAPQPFLNISQLWNPNAGIPKDVQQMAGYQPPNKLDRFESFLGNFLQSLGSGFANEGHGPGAWARGAGAAMQAPYQQALQLHQMGIQERSLQSQEELRKAQEEFNRQRAREFEMVSVPQIGPDGKPTGQIIQLPAKEAGPYLSRIGAAGVTGAAGIEKTRITAENKLEVEALKTRIMQGTATKFIPDTDASGRMFYRVMNKFGQELNQVDVNAIKDFLGKQTSTYEIKQGPDGSLFRVPKVTTSGVVIPNRQSTSGGMGIREDSMPKGKGFWATSDSRGGIGGAAVPIVDKAGNPVFGKMAANIETMSRTAEATLPHLPVVLSEMEQLDRMGLLGEFKGKATNLMASKGFAVPGLTSEQRELLGKFINDVKLVDSAMLRTHFGARGGQEMYGKFVEMLNAGEDVDVMRGGISSFQDFLEGYKDMIYQHPIAGGGANKANKAGSAGGGGSSDSQQKAKTNKDGFVIANPH